MAGRRALALKTTAAALAVLVVASLLGIGDHLAGAEPGGIVISELNYHAGSDLDGDDFLELTNTSASPIDVSGWSFTAGVTGTLAPGTVIPAGGRFVVGKDAVRFATTYGFAPDATYGGNLSNSGETVTIADASLAIVDTVTYADAAPWPPAADGNGPSLELRGLLSDNTQPENWGASLAPGGTPRAVNSLDGTAPPPQVKDLTATPRRPAPGEAVVVSARLPIGSVASLTYRVMFGADVVVPFLDDAASPGGANDGVFAASIPGQGAGQLIRYRVAAVASGGEAFQSPPAGDGINYHGVVVTNPSVATNLPVIEWFMEDATYADILANHRFDDVQAEAVIAYDGTVYDNARMNVRGQSSRSLDPVNWKVEMPAGHDLDFRPYLPYLVDEWALQRDPDPLADIAWDTIAQSGARSLSIKAVRSQRNGQFWSVGRVMELEDGTWRKAQGVDDWAIYKGDGGGLTRTSSVAQLEANLWLDKKTRESEDQSDAWALSQAIDAPASATQKAWLEANVNVPALVNYLAVSSLIRHTDSGWKNWYLARDTEGTGRWELWFWDVNWTFTTDGEDHNGLFLTPDVNNRLVQAMLAYPDFREMFFRRLRTLADQFLTPGRYEAQWDAITTPYNSPDWNLDVAAWPTLRTPELARTKFLQGLSDRRTVIAQNTGPGKPVPASQSAAPNVVINEIQYAPVGGDAAEFIELTNPGTESVDLSGWTIDGIGLTIQSGTVLLPGAQVVFVKDDVAFRTAYGSSRFIGGQYSGALADDGETIRLLQGTRVVDEVSYGVADPWPAAARGTGPSLELGDPAFDNSLPANWYATSSTGGSPGAPNVGVIPPDTTPPSAPPSLSAGAVTPTGVTLSWDPAIDDRAVASYRLYRDGAVVAPSIAGLSATDGGLAAGTTYAYTVRAIDGAGNESADSPAAMVTTSPTYVPALFADDFTGADGSAWRSAWVANGTNSSTALSGDAGRLAVNDVAGAAAQAQLAGLTARADSDVTFSYQWSSSAAQAYFNVYARGSGGWQNTYRPRSGYGLQLQSNSGTVQLIRNVNGSVTTLRSVSGGQTVGTTKQWVRLRIVGSTIQFKVWRDGVAEPAAWTGTNTDTSVTAAGQLYLSVVRAGSNVGAKSVSIDDLVVTGGTVAPPPDTAAPSVPTGLAAPTIGQNQVGLTWNASTDNVGVTAYQVLRNGTVVGTSATTSFTDTGLSPATSYSYTVRATDAAGNTSAASGALAVTTQAAAGSLFADTFTGTNGSAWGSAWTSTVASGTVDRQANAGRLTYNDAAGAYARSILTGVAARTDSELLLSYQWNSSTAGAYFNVYLRGSGGWANAYRPRNGYGLELSSSSSTVTLKKVVNGTTTNIRSVSGANTIGTGKQWVRLRVVGSTIQFKVWRDGIAEPTAWSGTDTDTQVTAGGQAHLSIARGGSSVGIRTVTVDDLVLNAG